MLNLNFLIGSSIWLFHTVFCPILVSTSHFCSSLKLSNFTKTDESVEDDPRSKQPFVVDNDRLLNLIYSDRRQTQLAKSFISIETINTKLPSRNRKSSKSTTEYSTLALTQNSTETFTFTSLSRMICELLFLVNKI